MTTPSTTDSVVNCLLCLAGPAIWGAHLAALYGAHTLICARMASAADNMWVFVASAATVLSLLGLALVVARSSRLIATPSQPFLRKFSVALAALSALGVIWSALPAALVAPCR